MNEAQGFAYNLLWELQKLDSRADALKIRAKGKIAILSIDDGEFVPLLRLADPTPKFAKMMLFVRHKRAWHTTCYKDTAEMLAKLLAGEFAYLWTIPVSMVGWHTDSSSPKTD